MHDEDDDDDEDEDDGDNDYADEEVDEEVKNSTVILCLQFIQIEALVLLVEVPEVLEGGGVYMGGVKGHLERLLRSRITVTRGTANQNPAI